jgi:hypothetical protein
MEKELICTICCATYTVDEPKTLNEIDINEIESTEIILNPCRNHSYCIGCLRFLALNFDNHHIGYEDPFIKCEPTFEDEECINIMGLPNYFMHNDIRKILSDEEYQQYTVHAEKHQFPGYEVIKCPRPIIENGHIKRCEAGILVPIDVIKTTDRGDLIIFCDQNDLCYRKTCYHCQNLVGRRARNCMHCMTMNEANDPQAYNHYFYRPGKQPRDGKEKMFRNKDLTKKIILDQIKEIILSDYPLVKCFECLVIMEKTEQCNTLSHCGMERCYCCGRSGTTTHDLGDHWDTSGMHGCPRFDHSRYWNEIANCKFQCSEGKCYGHDIGSCKNSKHAKGVKNMAEERKKCQIYHAIFSLLPDMREIILREMLKNSKLKKYVPKYSSSDVRTCLPDTLHKYFVMQNKKKNTNITEEERNTYMRHFTPIVIIPERSSQRTKKMRDVVNELVVNSVKINIPSDSEINNDTTESNTPPSDVQIPIPASNNIRSLFSDLYTKYA